MAHQNILNAVKIELNYFMQTNNASNIMHARATGPITLALLDTLETVLKDWLTTEWATLASTTWSAQSIILTGENSLFDPRKAYPLSPAIAGTLTGGALPANATLAVKANIGRRGKGVNGRVFWVGLDGSQVTDNFIGSTEGNAIVAALNALNASVAALVGFEGLCVPHLVVGGAHPPDASSDIIVDFSLADNAVDSQKDRLPFHKKRKRFPVA